MRILAPVAGALAALALLPALASAAPDRSLELTALDTSVEWSSEVASGFVYNSDVAGNLDLCTPGLFSCDQTLIKTTELGDLKLTFAGKGVGDQDTLSDIDVFVFPANEAGEAQGEALGKDTSADAQEQVVLEDAEPGFYLLQVDWYLGVGSYDGTATLSTPINEEELPDEEGEL